jgi:hypothetical protein
MRAGFRDVTFIIKKEIEKDFREVMDPHLAGKDINVKYVFQEIDKNLPEGFEIPEGRRKPWGTAHALLCCLGTVDAPFAVINADDYYGVHAFEKIYNFLKNTDSESYDYAMVGYLIKNTVTEEGTVSRGVCESNDNGYLTSIVERTKIGTRNGDIYFVEDGKEYPLDPDTLVSMNLWALTPTYLRECKARFPKFLEDNVPKNPEKCEFLLPTVAAELIKEGIANVKVLDNTDKWYGVTYKEDKPAVVQAFRDLKAQGVYPKNF